MTAAGENVLMVAASWLCALVVVVVALRPER